MEAPDAPSPAPAWPFGDLPRHGFSLIYADPPWRFASWGSGKTNKAPDHHYPVMSLDHIKALPVGSLAAKDCALVMWACAPTLDQAIDTVKAWGFTFKTAGAWAKQSKTGRSLAFGTGYIFRSAAEFYLVGTRGQPRSAVRDVRNLIVSPVREHSRKPEKMRRDLERMFPGVAKVELFARQPAPNWSSWGNQTDRFDSAVPLFDRAPAVTAQLPLSGGSHYVTAG